MPKHHNTQAPYTHGGRRLGAGRKPRQDGRRLRVLKVALTDAEFERIRKLSTDQRREALLAAIAAHEGYAGEPAGRVE